jgi:broad specificity phosphatase PhoE
MAQLWLARHGQTDDNLAGDVFQGFRDTPLNATGRAQAAVLGRWIRDEMTPTVSHMWCSDLRRAHETAQIVGEAINIAPVLDPRLREGNRGSWEGRRFAEVAAAEPERYRAWLAAGPRFRFPDGESLAEQQARVLAALADIAAAMAGAVTSALVVCHRGSIRVALCRDDPRGLWAFHDHDVDNTGLVAW